MPKLNWKDIITRVANNAGIENITPYQKNSIQNHIKDTLIKIHRIAEDNLKSVKYAIFDGLPLSNTPAISIITDVGAGFTDVEAGFYKYRFVYYNALQGESEPVDSETIELAVPDDEKIYVSGIPERPHGVDSIKVYRTYVNGTTFYLNRTLSADQTAFYDNIPDSSMTVAYTTPAKYANESDIPFPDDYIALRQATFYDTSNNEVFAVEAYSEEVFNRFKPENFSDQVEIRSILDGSADFNESGLSNSLINGNAILYTVQDTLPITFNYKRRIAGYLQFLYVAIPEPDMAALTTSPDIVYAYYDVIVDGATYRYLRTRLLNVQNEMQAQAITLAVRLAKADFLDALKNYTGLVKRTADVQIMQIPSLLSDASMDIG